ncbi:MAG: UDP-N-acetylglucosamine--N-acetylmuramyl-(pentapeptide) pyrophosphoryl-undecaprenol N-acetylglucosamine transferase [Clostridiales bacterium]|nr:UDP-N-acetylglucosamine--N-acetylmuramyl-(pentapeptide) pyrophosphoryl-undecaprenol N-acetylglucosamine transferase [Clostridiales bacterium]
MKTVILTGGGTAGHVTPSLALIPELKKYFDKIIYVGSRNGIEKDLAKKHGLEYFFVPTVKLERKLTLKNTAIPFKLLFGIREAKKLLRGINPSVIFSKGGFVSLPTVIAGKKLGIPVVSHESDMTVGLANKIGAKCSTAFLTSFDCTQVNCNKKIYTGSPINQKLFENKDKGEILKKYGLSGRKKILLVFGGSSGSKIINENLRKCLYRLVNRYDVIHVCGKGKRENIKTKGYTEIEFCENIDQLFYVADLVVCRAGANSLFELTSIAKPTLAIPLSKKASRGDQIDNAKYFEKRKMIEVLQEENLTEESLYNGIIKLESHADTLKENCKARFSSSPNKKIAEIISKYSK